MSDEPVAWIRYCYDGSCEGPIMHKLMEDVRKKSGEWTPLFERDAETARLRADARFREETTSNCWCATCRPIKMGKDMRMVLCPECGNKRCPHATDHNNECTARKATK